ncbi:Hint domain-containing protein [Rhodoblastus sp. 17X3]|uniref:Hint domain-containing protein n=1 Tax=Rhodoblastus sp. 17X3 TaxID=3047026 RepID=UPI0024B673F8|nr:Hint domain-containing protein [Rhodoblastus sp. 17X3]MDI9849624.1 Hint domain-containing protein [Rhodoblastus sp. 17X3]
MKSRDFPVVTSAIISTFWGISDPTNWPPQNALAVGPYYAITAESSQIQWTLLSTGVTSSPESFYDLFSSAGVSSIYDARLAYDSSCGDYVLSAIQLNSDGSYTLDFAVTQNPSAGWSVAYLNVGQPIPGTTTEPDVPVISVGGGEIYVTTAQDNGSDFAGSAQWIVPEAAVAAGGSIAGVVAAIAPGSDGIMRPVTGFSGSTYTTYFFGARSDGSEVKLSYQTYDAANGYSAVQTLSPGNANIGSGSGDFLASQPGGAPQLDALDSRIQGLAYETLNGRNYVFGVSEAQVSSGSQPVVAWFQYDVTTPGSPQFVAGGEITGASTGLGADVAIFNPSIAVNAAGDVLINFTASGTSLLPSDYYVVAGPNQNFSAPTLYQSSNSALINNPLGSADPATGVQRWGLNSTAVADPNNPNGFWISNEFVSNDPAVVNIPAGSNAWWGTVTAQVEVTCFTSGTQILTPDGEVFVESLKAGDLVLTADGRALPVRWLGRQTVSTIFGDKLRVLPIRIKAGALDDNVPSRDLVISPDHAVLIDGVLAQAATLVNEISIVREFNASPILTYFHIELDEHSVIFAENTPVETFVDNVDRLRFDNWTEHVALYPDGKPMAEMPYPRAKARRQIPDRIRDRLAERARNLGVAAVTSVA